MMKGSDGRRINGALQTLVKIGEPADGRCPSSIAHAILGLRLEEPQE